MRRFDELDDYNCAKMSRSTPQIGVQFVSSKVPIDVQMSTDQVSYLDPAYTYVDSFISASILVLHLLLKL